MSLVKLPWCVLICDLAAQLSGGEQQMLSIGLALMLQKGQVVLAGSADEVAGSGALAGYLGV